MTSVKLCIAGLATPYTRTPELYPYHSFPADRFYKTVDHTRKRFGDDVDSSNNGRISVHASFPGSTWSVPVGSSDEAGVRWAYIWGILFELHIFVKYMLVHSAISCSISGSGSERMSATLYTRHSPTEYSFILSLTSLLTVRTNRIAR